MSIHFNREDVAEEGVQPTYTKEKPETVPKR